MEVVVGVDDGWRWCGGGGMMDEGSGGVNDRQGSLHR